VNRLWVVFKKELLDSSRDRRSILAALAFSFFGPVLMAVAFTVIAQKQAETEELKLAVIGIEHAPDLIQFIEQHGIEPFAFDEDAKTAIQQRQIEVVLEIDHDFPNYFSKSIPAQVKLLTDYSIEKSARAARRVSGVIARYNERIGSARLMVRGINPAITKPVDLESNDYSTPQGRSALILGGLQIFLLMATFVGSTGVAIDTTAGERERHSLEPLLVHPVSSVSLLAGKWLTTSLYGMLAVVLTMLVTTSVFPFVPLKSLGVDLNLGISMQLSIVALALPLALFAAAVQMLTSLYAKSFKEAQSYLSIMIMIPMLPVMAMQLLSLKSATWMYLVPVLGQQQLLTDVMRGDGLEPLNYCLASGMTSILALATVMFLTRLLRTERVVYGG
jgi:sodium transport system permease protein